MAVSFNEIITRMLERVPDSFDKREGSIIWDALAPAAYELSLAYEEMDKLYNNTFASTADRSGLVARASEYDVVPLEATYATRRGVFSPSSVEIPMGERFNLGEYNYYVIAKEADGVYLLSCETAGPAGNADYGALLPIGYVSGLETAQLTDVVIYGEEEEATETFRKRFLAVLRGDAKDGNVAQYQLWASTFTGVGNAKVIPLWNGSNTVKVSILDAENRPATAELIGDFQDYLDPNSTGLGNGVAPIGAVVTVSTATEVPLVLAGTVSLASGYSAVEGVEDAVRAYLKEIAYAKNSVPYMSLGAVIQNCACIDFLSDFTVNAGISNIELEAEQIGVLQSLTLEVV